MLFLGIGLSLGFLLGYAYHSMMLRRPDDSVPVRAMIADVVADGGDPDDEVVFKLKDVRAAHALLREQAETIDELGTNLSTARLRIEEVEAKVVTLTPPPADVKIVTTPAAPKPRKRPAKQPTTRSRKR